MSQNSVLGAAFAFCYYLVGELLFGVVCFYIGFCFARIITLGKSPQYPHDHHLGFSILGAVILFGPPFIYLLWIS